MNAAGNGSGLGRFYGVGLGPGDPELVTIKAAKLLASGLVVAYFAKQGGRGRARRILEPWLNPASEELPLSYPLTTEVDFCDPAYVTALRSFYEAAAATIAAHLRAGRDVALVCEGDPLFYGSFMHLYVRLKQDFDVTIIPGITGMSGCWARAATPMTWGDDVLAILPGTLPQADLARHLCQSDAAVIIKVGANLKKIRIAIAAAGKAERAIYVEYGTMDNERIMPLCEKQDDAAPYFSLVLIPGEGRRP
ncbi:MAG: precorrin-2 C(20)-methyltransferase [Beijerinckiaceae bacterium]